MGISKLNKKRNEKKRFQMKTKIKIQGWANKIERKRKKTKEKYGQRTHTYINEYRRQKA